MIRVLLVDDQQLLRSGLRSLLDAEDDITVVGEAGDGDDAVTRTSEHGPDVVLMDIRMPRTDGLSATRTITADPSLADVRIVILTTFEHDEYIFEALRSGASGFLVKDTEPSELIRAVRTAAAGDSLLSPSVTRTLIAEYASRAKPARLAPEPRRAHRARARGHHPRRRRAVQRRDRRPARDQPDDRQDPRQPGDDQAGRPRPGPARRLRLRDRSRHAGLDGRLTPFLSFATGPIGPVPKDRTGERDSVRGHVRSLRLLQHAGEDRRVLRRHVRRRDARRELQRRADQRHLRRRRRARRHAAAARCSTGA